MARSRIVWVAAGIALALAATEASACSRVSPDDSLRMSAEELDQEARRVLDGATAVIEGTVMRPPYLRPQRGPTPPPGLLRVDRVLSGNAPPMVETYWHPCGIFGQVGERMTVVLHSQGRPTYVHPDVAAAIGRRLRGG